MTHACMHASDPTNQAISSPVNSNSNTRGMTSSFIIVPTGATNGPLPHHTTPIRPGCAHAHHTPTQPPGTNNNNKRDSKEDPIHPVLCLAFLVRTPLPLGWPACLTGCLPAVGPPPGTTPGAARRAGPSPSLPRPRRGKGGRTERTNIIHSQEEATRTATTPASPPPSAGTTRPPPPFFRLLTHSPPPPRGAAPRGMDAPPTPLDPDRIFRSECNNNHPGPTPRPHAGWMPPSIPSLPPTHHTDGDSQGLGTPGTTTNPPDIIAGPTRRRSALPAAAPPAPPTKGPLPPPLGAPPPRTLHIQPSLLPHPPCAPHRESPTTPTPPRRPPPRTARRGRDTHILLDSTGTAGLAAPQPQPRARSAWVPLLPA